MKLVTTDDVTIRTILHPTDFSDSATRALDVAVRFAVTHGATLRILHAELIHGTEPRVEAAWLDRYAESARRHLEAMAPGDIPPLDVVSGRAVFPHDAILEAATERHADLIVMGTEGRSGLGTLFMGSTAERVLRQAPCHVVTVRAHAAVPDDAVFRTVLVPVDFSDGSACGLAGARALATDERASLHLIHVVEPLPPLYYAGRITSQFELDGELHARLETRLRDQTSGWPHADVFVREGHPAVEITRLADETQVDLIVMSTKGRTGADWLPVGSVTERVCRMANVPVLAVRPEASPDGSRGTRPADRPGRTPGRL